MVVVCLVCTFEYRIKQKQTIMKTLFTTTFDNVTATIKTDDNKRLFVTYKNNVTKQTVSEYDVYKKQIDHVLAVINVRFLQGYGSIFRNGNKIDRTGYTLWSY